MRFWEALLSSFLRRVVRQGTLVVRHANDRVEQFGEAGSASVTVRLRDRRVARAIVLNPSLGLGEAYVDGRLTVDDDNLYGLLELLIVNLAMRGDAWHEPLLRPFRRAGRRLTQVNPPVRARRNASHHYDLSGALYELFLDPDRQYSCAYFTDPSQGLAAAQEAKKDLIAAKLLLKPGHRVLDIGCGWGGLALHLAKVFGAQVTGITLSEQQYRTASETAHDSGLPTRPVFQLEDYRQVSGTFDRIVSVGMFEHVGTPHYREFFEVVRNRLAHDGVALIHTIGRAHGPAATDPWIARYVFPGAVMPALSEIAPAVERAGLFLTDLEVWRLHYAATLRAWRERFEVNRQAVRALYDERFCRMWTYYFVASELAFRHAGLVVFQLQLAKRQDAVPLTRNYLAPQVAPTEAMAEMA